MSGSARASFAAVEAIFWFAPISIGQLNTRATDLPKLGLEPEWADWIAFSHLLRPLRPSAGGCAPSGSGIRHAALPALPAARLTLTRVRRHGKLRPFLG